MTHFLHFLTKAFQRLSMKAAMLVVAAMLFMPQGAKGEDWNDKYLYDSIQYNASTTTLTFRVGYYDFRQVNEGFVSGDGLTVKAKIKGTSNYVRLYRVRATGTKKDAPKGVDKEKVCHIV